MPFDIGIAVVVGAALVFFVMGRIRRILRRETLRLPDGQRALNRLQLTRITPV